MFISKVCLQNACEGKTSNVGLVLLSVKGWPRSGLEEHSSKAFALPSPAWVTTWTGQAQFQVLQHTGGLYAEEPVCALHLKLALAHSAVLTSALDHSLCHQQRHMSVTLMYAGVTNILWTFEGMFAIHLNLTGVFPFGRTQSPEMCLERRLFVFNLSPSTQLDVSNPALCVR